MLWTVIRFRENEVGWHNLLQRIRPGIPAGRRYRAHVLEMLTLPIPALDSPFPDAFRAGVSDSRTTKETAAATTRGSLRLLQLAV